MYKRSLNLPIQKNFFLFGPRSTGKSTLLREQFQGENAYWIDLLDPKTEARYAREPSDLIALHDSLPETVQHIVIDEVQKLPKLLDVIHLLIEKKQRYFVMTGSSARKLKHGGANLLAGRALVYNLGAFSFLELGSDFNLDRALSFGLLPKVWAPQTDEDRIDFLEAYALTYLKEEIWSEQLIRKLDPFRRFLEVAAQCNGKIINFNNIARDVGVSDKTVKEYYSILEDTLIGFFVEPFHSSLRKRLSQKPKFYFFDVGVSRVLSRLLKVPLLPQTNAYGDTFEHFIIAEVLKLAQYYHRDYRFSYFHTKDGAEIDLIVDRPGKALLLIEIKSASQITESILSKFTKLSSEFKNAEAICLCNEPHQKSYGAMKVFPWQQGLELYFGATV